MDGEREYSFCDSEFFELPAGGDQGHFAEFSDSSSASGSVSLPSTPENLFLPDYHQEHQVIKNQSSAKKLSKSKKPRLMSKSKKLERKQSHNSVSETSSEEGYYTSTSPELLGSDCSHNELNKHSKLPPIAHHDEAIERSNTKEEDDEIWKNSVETQLDTRRRKSKEVTSERTTIEPLGLSPRLLFPNKKGQSTYVNPSRQWPPPKSPAYSKRPQFKGLATLAGSMNNLASIPEAEQELTQLRPLSRKMQQSMGGSWDNIAALIQSDSFQVKPKKSKPHYIAPMDLSPRLSKVLNCLERGHSFTRESSRDNKTDLLRDVDASKPKNLVREHSTLSEAGSRSRKKKAVHH